MRVLVAHNKYREPGGEDVVAAAEAELLAENGHKVRRYTVENNDIVGLGQKLSTAWNAPYSHMAKGRLAEEIRAFHPDLVHVHNFFPILTPAIYDACRDANVPVVQSLHNFRLVCPKATLFRRGRPCETCVHASPYHAVLHSCYRGSRLQSLVPARMVAVNRRRGTWSDKVSRFVALSAFARDKFVGAGLPADKIDVKPNFTPGAVRRNTDAQNRRSGALFVGRLSEEKGIEPLLKAWRDLSVPLRIAGDGPMAPMVADQAGPHIEHLGALSPAAIEREMATAAFLVVPSLWYEMFPMVIAEAFAAGLPAIVSRLGSLAEIVEDGATGLHFNPNDTGDFAEKIQWATDHPAEMLKKGKRARLAYEQNYTASANYRQLMAIYGKAGASNANPADA